MNSSVRTFSMGDSENSVKGINFKTPIPNLTIKMACPRTTRTSRRRFTFSPNINSTVMSSPDCSPIKGEACVLNMSTSPSDFSSRSPNQTIESECEVSSFFNLSYLNKTISIENILKSRNMEKYIEIFHKHEIYNLAVFKSLTEQDLIDIGINKKKDRLMILEVVAAYKDEF